MKSILFSVFYNRGQQAKNSIQSLLDAAPIDSTIVLVDDGSTDDTFTQLSQFKSDKRVVVETGENQGFTQSLVSAINKFADEEKYNYLGIHGSGDLCEPTKFEKQIQYLEKNEDVVAVGCGHTVRSYTTDNIVLKEDTFYEATEENLHSRVPFTHGTVVYRLKVYKEVGGYSPVFKYSQDKDLYFKLIKKGRIVRYPESLYTQFVFEDSASANPKKKREQMKYQKLILLQYTDYKAYEEKVEKLKECSIHDIFFDKDLLDKYIWAQKRLVYQGEFGMASEWCDLIYSVNGSSKQKRLKSVLVFIEKSSVMKWLTAKAFYIGRQVLR